MATPLAFVPQLRGSPGTISVTFSVDVNAWLRYKMAYQHCQKFQKARELYWKLSYFFRETWSSTLSLNFQSRNLLLFFCRFHSVATNLCVFCCVVFEILPRICVMRIALSAIVVCRTECRKLPVRICCVVFDLLLNLNWVRSSFLFDTLLYVYEIEFCFE